MRILVHKKARRKLGPKPVERVKLHITKGDTVQVISGANSGKRAKVLRVHTKTGRVTLESLTTGDQPVAGDSGHPGLSGDGSGARSRCKWFTGRRVRVRHGDRHRAPGQRR